MFTLFVRHTVENYEKWKQGYDKFARRRKAVGVKSASVHIDPNDPNTVIVTHQFEDGHAAMAYAKSEELKSAMAKAGVLGKPDIWFGEDVEETPY